MHRSDGHGGHGSIHLEGGYTIARDDAAAFHHQTPRPARGHGLGQRLTIDEHQVCGMTGIKAIVGDVHDLGAAPSHHIDDAPDVAIATQIVAFAQIA